MKKYIFLLSAIVLLFLSGRLFAQEVTGQYYTSFDGAKIYYEVKGEGFPVILIHGFTGTGQGWKNGQLYGDLLKAGYKVIILDQRGNGRSDKPHTDAGYNNDAESKDVMGLATSLGLKQYDVVGYSRGSIIVSRLLVLDKRIHKGVIGGMGDAYTNPKWPRRIHAYEALMGDTSHHDVDEMVKYIKSQKFDVLALALQQKYQPSTSKAELAKVKIPVLIVRGTEDQETGADAGTNSEVRLQKMIPNAQVAYVPGDHNNASRGAEFSKAVIDFLK